MKIKFAWFSSAVSILHSFYQVKNLQSDLQLILLALLYLQKESSLPPRGLRLYPHFQSPRMSISWRAILTSVIRSKASFQTWQLSHNPSLVCWKSNFNGCQSMISLSTASRCPWCPHCPFITLMPIFTPNWSWMHPGFMALDMPSSPRPRIPKHQCGSSNVGPDPSMMLNEIMPPLNWNVLASGGPCPRLITSFRAFQSSMSSRITTH